ncbi:MAG: response regulator [Pseudomonadota bacterium]
MMDLERNANILIVEDELASLNLLASYFEKEAYTVFKASSGEQALAILGKKTVDVILMDINLPGKDGLSLTRELRAHSRVGIILVTSKKDDIDRIVGLELGADDYVTKPYNPRELIVRVRNLLQRLGEVAPNESSVTSAHKDISFDGWTLNPGRRLLRADSGDSVQLTEGEFKLLAALIDDAGKVLSRDTLMNRMERRDWLPSDRTIDVLIARIRKKLGDDKDMPRYINTAHGTGYIFVADVQLQ